MTNTTDNTTPRPWVLLDCKDKFFDYKILSDSGIVYGNYEYSDLSIQLDDAALIVRCVNSHDALVEALKLVDEAMRKGVIDDGCYLETRIRNKPAHAVSVHDVVKKALAQAKGE